jgi:hypothetical protein
VTDGDRNDDAELDPAVVEEYMMAVLVRDGFTVMRTAEGRYTVVAPGGIEGILKDPGDTLTLTDLVRFARALMGDDVPPAEESDS